MQAIIMAGGEGSRLRPLTCDRPKPMVPLVNKPVMEHTVDLLRELGWRDIGVTLQYLPQEIINYFGNGSNFGVRMQYFIEDVPLGTAGSVKNASVFIKDTFLVISGDALTDFDLKSALEFHKSKGSWATLILKQVNIPLEYGVVITAKDGTISRFLEKPGWGEVFSDTVNTGIYILEPQVLQYVPDKQKFDFSKDLFPMLMREGKPMYGYQAQGYWCDIGSLEQYQQANIDVMEGIARVVGIKEKNFGNNTWLGKNVRISKGAVLNGPVIIGDDAVIEAGAKVGPFAVIGAKSRIGSHASVARSVLWDGVVIGPNAQIKGAVLCNQVKAQARSAVFEGAVLGDRVVIESMGQVKPATKIWPEKTIRKDTIIKDNLIWGQFGSKNIFGATGVSGTLNVDILPEFTSRLGAAFGATMGVGQQVVVSSDGRPGSIMIKLSLTSGLLSVGSKVIDIGEVNAPLHRFNIRKLEATAGLHVEQSEERINIKLSDSKGIPISRNLERKIESLLQREDFPRATGAELGQIQYSANVYEAYHRHLSDMVKKEQVNRWQPKIICSYGGLNKTVGKKIIEPLLTSLGCKIIIESMGSISEVVLRERADLGVIFSDSGEMFELVDEKGRKLDKEHYLMLTAALLLNKNQNSAVAVPVSLSGAIEQIAQAKGGRVVRTKNSTQQYLEQLFNDELLQNQKNLPQYLLAFDGLAGLVGLIDFLAESELTLSEFIDTIPKVCSSKKAIDCPWENKGKVMRSLIEEHASDNVELIDGIKVYRDRGWALILPDVDEPLYHVFSEGADFEVAESLADFYVEKIKDIVKQ